MHVHDMCMMVLGFSMQKTSEKKVIFTCLYLC
jgi:hypothetical protein